MTNRQRITVRADEVRVGDVMIGETTAVVRLVQPGIYLVWEYEDGSQDEAGYRLDEKVEVERPVPTVTVELPVDVAERFVDGVSKWGPADERALGDAVRDALAGRDNPDSGQPACDHCGQPVTRSAPNRPVWIHATGWHYGKDDHHHAEVNGSMFMPEAQS